MNGAVQTTVPEARILELTPEDMTVTVETGLTLATLQSELAQHRQWLPIDPAHPERLSIHDLLAQNLSGPRRYGYGTIREHVIGLKVTCADGRVIKSGGKVVKNVAGYDMAKLFIGARGTLGLISEVTFKLRPLPEVERILGITVPATRAAELVRAVLQSELTPVVIDLHRLNRDEPTLIISLAGTAEEVAWQVDRAAALGFHDETTLAYENTFWADPAPATHLSVLPSRLMEVVGRLGSAPFVARAGNGVIYFRGAVLSQTRTMPLELMRRVKKAFDPKFSLPEFVP